MELNDLFWSIQCEGKNAGRHTLFVRMPYCNLACSWCDTEFNSFKKWTEEEFVKVAKEFSKSAFAVITGGEPTMNKHTPRVIELLKDLGFEIAMESNGTFAPPAGVDFLTVSPKRGSHFVIHPQAVQHHGEVKYVVDKGFNFDVLNMYHLNHKAKYLSPEFTNVEYNVETILRYVEGHPDWKLSLQSNKWVNLE